MTDVHNPETRSFNMSQIRGKDTKPELLVRKFLYAHGYRYRIHLEKLPGKPDIVLTSRKTIIDVKGCYWHRHEGCRFSTMPKTNVEFYKKKFAETVERDRKNKISWETEGWAVIEIWECELRNSEQREKRLFYLLEELNN